MNTVWLFLLLFALVTWAVGTFIDHYLLTRYKAQVDSASTVGTLVLISSFFALVVGSFIYLLAHGLAHEGVIAADPLDLSGKEMLLAMGVGVLEILWLMPYLYALDEADETQVCPLFQLVPVFGFILGLTFFDEVPSSLELLAGCIILAGSFVLNMELRKKGEEEGYGGVNVRVVALMALASFIIALAAFLFKGTALEENYWGTAFWMSVGSFATGMVLWAVVPSYRRDFHAFVGRRDAFGLAVNFVNEIADNVAILAFYGAVVLGPSTALVQASIALQPLFVLLIGLLAARLGSTFHRERLRGAGLAVRVVGILCIVAGSVVLFGGDEGDTIEGLHDSGEHHEAQQKNNDIPQQPIAHRGSV